jgi:hypothetical protein
MVRVAMTMRLHEYMKYLTLAFGMAFSALIISQQSAIFYSVLMTSTRSIREANVADIWVLKTGVEILDEAEPSIYVGQQLDVFISLGEDPPTANPAEPSLVPKDG